MKDRPHAALEVVAVLAIAASEQIKQLLVDVLGYGSDFGFTS